MKKQMANKVFYSLNIDDIQTVSQQEINRDLSIIEIESIKEMIVSKINWYDAIADTINQEIRS